MPDMDRPNVLLITTDQQRFDTFGRFKPSFMRTPHLDHLAAESVTFTRAYADCPLCVPARMSIMTGKTALGHGMFGNGASSNVIGRTETLPAYLNDLGYQTYAVGKMHFTPIRARHGFGDILLPADYYAEMRRRGYDLQPMRHGLGQNEITPGMSTVPEALTHTAWVAEKCREFIMERRDPTAPWFLWCSFSKPHPPFDPPEPYYSMYRDCDIPPPVLGDWSRGDNAPESFRRQCDGYLCESFSPETWREARAAYYGLITQIDYNLGRVLAAVRETSESGGLDETLIVFASDHGEYVGDHGSIAKSFFHEAAAHVPLIVKAPSSFEAGLYGVECDRLATHADLLPTVLQAGGGGTPDGVEGRDLAALARGEASALPYVEAIVGQGADTTRACIAITDGRWKYFWFPEGGRELLFDLVNDPRETTDLSARPEHRAKRDELRTELVRRHKDRPYGYVQDGDLATYPLIDDRANGKRRIHRWAPGYLTEYEDVDTIH